MTRHSRRIQLAESATRHWPDNYHNVYTFEQNFNDNEGNDDLIAPLGTGNFSWSAGTGQVDDELKLDAIATVASKTDHSFWLADEEGDLPFSIVASIKKRGSGMSGITISNSPDWKDWQGNFVDNPDGHYEWIGNAFIEKFTGNGTWYLAGADISGKYNVYHKESDHNSGVHLYIIYSKSHSSPNNSEAWLIKGSSKTPAEVLTGVGVFGNGYSSVINGTQQERGRYSPPAILNDCVYDFDDLDREIVGFYESGNGDCLAKLAIDPTGRIYFNRYSKDSQSNYRYLSSCNDPLNWGTSGTGTGLTKNYHSDYSEGDWINIMIPCSGIIDEVVEDKMYIDGVEIATGSLNSSGGIFNEEGNAYKGMEDFSNGVVFRIGKGCREMSLDEIVLINEELDSSDATDINTDFTNGTGSGG